LISDIIGCGIDTLFNLGGIKRGAVGKESIFFRKKGGLRCRGFPRPAEILLGRRKKEGKGIEVLCRCNNLKGGGIKDKECLFL